MYACVLLSIVVALPPYIRIVCCARARRGPAQSHAVQYTPRTIRLPPSAAVEGREKSFRSAFAVPRLSGLCCTLSLNIHAVQYVYRPR
eukprot:COSAG02_NODE_942_length_15746_cov_6.164632_19_plen_88_part_00